MAEELKMAVGSDQAAMPVQTSPAQVSTPSVSPAPTLPVPVLPKATEKKNIFSELFSGLGSKKPENVKQVEKDKMPSAAIPVSGYSTSVKKSKPGTLMLKVALLLCALTGAFFFSQNSTKFTFLGQNPAIKNQLAHEQVANLNTELLVEKHLSAVMELEKFSKLGDEYFYAKEQIASAYVSENKKAEFKADIALLKPQMTAIILDLNANIADEVTVEEMDAAGAKIDQEIAELKSKGGEDQAVLADVQDLESARKLLRNHNFKSQIIAVNSDAPADTDYSALLTAYNGVNRSVASLISEIKSSRTLWSKYLDELERVSKKVDPLFGTEFKGNLSIASLGFAGEDQKISISGGSDTEDTKNFTLLANLLDAYEASDLFKDATQRSFSKNESKDTDSGTTSYSSSFEIEMSIQSDQK